MLACSHQVGVRWRLALWQNKKGLFEGLVHVCFKWAPPLQDMTSMLQQQAQARVAASCVQAL